MSDILLFRVAQLVEKKSEMAKELGSNHATDVENQKLRQRSEALQKEISELKRKTRKEVER